MTKNELFRAQLRFRLSSVYAPGAALAIVQYKIITGERSLNIARVLRFWAQVLRSLSCEGPTLGEIEDPLRPLTQYREPAIKYKMRAPPLIIHALCTHTRSHRMQTLSGAFHATAQCYKHSMFKRVLTLRRENRALGSGAECSVTNKIASLV